MYWYITLLSRFAQIKNCTIDESKSDPACQTTLPSLAADAGSVQKILSIVLGVIAGATLVFIIISALRFVLSQGEPDKVAKARNAVIFASIGLGIVLSAEVIVYFVLGRL
jgi:hypothetical protein